MMSPRPSSYLVAGFTLLGLAACAAAPANEAEGSSGSQLTDSVVQAKPIASGYEALTAQQKQAALWSLHTDPSAQYAPDHYPAFPGGLEVLLSVIKTTLKFDLSKSFTVNSDALPADRKASKPVHTYGSVAKVQFVPESKSPYTGMYRGAPKAGIIRLSLAAAPKSNFTTGIALKLFVSGKPSLNVLAMHGVDGQADNHNFFAYPQATHIPNPQAGGPKALVSFFRLASATPGHLEVSDFAAIGEDGERVAAPAAPECLVFRPGKAVANVISETSANDFRDDLARIPSGTTLYEVIAGHDVGDEADVPVTCEDTGNVIGRVETQSELLAAPFGDQVLFFQHQGLGQSTLK